jgi:hypothetical protein
MAIEHRVLVTPKLYPEGKDDGSPPGSFRLEIHTDRQRRDGRTRLWGNESPTERVIAAEGLTRNQVKDLIAEAADWLAWNGKD